MPRNYLGKILHTLVRAGILASCRGRGGGFRLAVEPRELSLLRVISLYDPIDERRRCLLGRPECSDRDPCPAHHRWKAAADVVATFFRETTVADVVNDAEHARVLERP